MLVSLKCLFVFWPIAAAVKHGDRQAMAINKNFEALDPIDGKRLDRALDVVRIRWQGGDCGFVQSTRNRFEKLVDLATTAIACPDIEYATQASERWSKWSSTEQQKNADWKSPFLEYAVSRHLNIIPETDARKGFEMDLLQSLLNQSFETKHPFEPYPPLIRATIEKDSSKEVHIYLCNNEDFGNTTQQIILNLAVAVYYCNNRPDLIDFALAWKKWWEGINGQQRHKPALGFLRYAILRRSSKIAAYPEVLQFEKTLADRYIKELKTFALTGYPHPYCSKEVDDCFREEKIAIAEAEKLVQELDSDT